MHSLLLAATTLAAGVILVQPRPADALTITLLFSSSPTTDIFGVRTTTANYTPYKFTGMSTAQIQQSILAAVASDFLDYPTGAPSPLAPGKELSINFEMATSFTAPVNGDPDYYRIAIGTSLSGGSFFGQACFSCVRMSSGAPSSGQPKGAVVGSVLTDKIAGLAGLATTNQQRINLIAGTVSHEIGHALSLSHANGKTANPGDSAYSLMATGAAPSYMPNNQRVLDRDFSYTEFDRLMKAVGSRTDTSYVLTGGGGDIPVPEPGSVSLFLLGTAALALRYRRRNHVAA